MTRRIPPAGIVPLILVALAVPGCQADPPTGDIAPGKAGDTPATVPTLDEASASVFAGLALKGIT
ncbi:MAG: hypothetical protein ACQET1_11440, partial [Gemmatimonadota bacterium]